VTIDMFERYASLDPAKEPGIQPEWSDMAPVLSPAFDWSEPEMQTQQQIPNQPPTKKQSRTGLLLGAAAIALIMAIGAAVLLSSGGASDQQPATTPSTTAAIEAAPAPIPTPSEAVAVADAWYVAFNAGDVDGVMALFAPDPTLSSNFGSTYTLEEERLINIWNAAQGTRLETDGCVPAGENSERRHVRCIGANHDALVRAVDATPVPAIVTMTIGPDGIVALSYSYGSPDFNHVSNPFDGWLAANHPDVEDFGFGSWETVEEAAASGTLRAQYAAEWATYLGANGCTYLDGC
jgi:hypothetical protein